MTDSLPGNEGWFKKHFSKVLVTVLVIALIGGGLWYMASFSPKLSVKNQRADLANVTPENKIIRMIGQWRGEDLREDYLMETIKEFEARNTNIAVKIKWNSSFLGGRDGAIKETINQFKTGKIAWDVIWLEPFYFQEIGNALSDQDWAKHYLVDFETVPGFKETQKSFILSDPQYRNHMNGVITAPYIEGFYQPFFYNKELTDKMGIEIKDKGMTFNDLLGYFKAVDNYNKKNKTDIPILYDSGDYKGGIGYAASTWNIFQSLFRSQFSSLAEVESTVPSEAKLATVRKVLGSLEELGKYKPLISGWKDLEWFGTRSYVLDNKAVFTVCGASWLYSHWHGIDAQKTMKMVPVEMPVYQPVDHYMGGYNPMFAVAKDSPVRDEAVKLMMSFATPNSSEKWIRYAKAPSGIKGNVSAAGSVSASTDQFDDFITYITDKYGGSVFDSKTVDYVLGEKYKDLTLKFTMHLGDVMDGKATADEAYAAILSDMKAVDNQ